MVDDWTNDQWEGAIRAVFRRAMLDEDFRQLTLQNPVEAFTAAAGRPPPPGLKLRFVEKLEEHVLVLPRFISTQSSPSEIDLSRILHHSFRQQSIPPPLRTGPGA